MCVSAGAFLCVGACVFWLVLWPEKCLFSPQTLYFLLNSFETIVFGLVFVCVSVCVGEGERKKERKRERQKDREREPNNQTKLSERGNNNERSGSFL